MQPQRFVFALNSELKESIRIMKLSPILSTEVREDLTYSPEVKSRNEGHFWGYFFQYVFIGTVPIAATMDTLRRERRELTIALFTSSMN